MQLNNGIELYNNNEYKNVGKACEKNKGLKLRRMNWKLKCLKNMN